MTTTLVFILMLLAAAVVVVGLFRMLGLPSVLGYLLVGALVGPKGLNLVPDTASARHLAEFGVVFLMFSIGLEFSLPKLVSMRRTVFGFGLAQVLVTVLVVIGLSLAFGLNWRAGVTLGGILAMSSTAVLSKLLAERMELDSAHGREVMGVLLFQDLAVVPFLVLIPELSQDPQEIAIALAVAAGKAALALFVILVVGQRLMRRWFHIVARRRSPELFMLNILLITLGLGFITEQAGLSMALGAFVAGMLISETEYRYLVEEDIKPFRDVLMGLFFVTIGMLLNMKVVIAQWHWVLMAVSALLIGKMGIVAALSRAFGSSPGTALRVGLWLCAGGEFGFVLLSLARGEKLLPTGVMQVTLVAILLSMLLAPLLAQYADRIVLRLVPSEWFLRSLQLTQIAAQSLTTEKHAILCGYGRNGQYLARFFDEEGVAYIALDLDPERVREAAAAGDTVVFGDAARREALVAAGISRASVVVVTFADVAQSLRVLHLIRDIRPDLPVVVRTFDETDLDKLTAAGAAEVVPESLESSIMLATHALALLGVPLNRILKRIRTIRGDRYRLLRGIYRGADHLAEEAAQDMHQLRLHTVILDPQAWGVGRTLADVCLDRFGVQVSAIRRRKIKATEPAPETRLEANDAVVLLGEPAGLSSAEEVLLKGW